MRINKNFKKAKKNIERARTHHKERVNEFAILQMAMLIRIFIKRRKRNKLALKETREKEKER
jgi:hypothetical protein